jgi:hypothetical protein
MATPLFARGLQEVMPLIHERRQVGESWATHYA